MSAHSVVGALPVAALLSTALGWAADPGISDTRILIGQCAAFSGPAQALGNGMRLGLEASLDQVNTSGGINGRTVELVTADDGYEPAACADGTRTLITTSQVFCLAGYVGTPTAKAALPVLREHRVPLIGLFTGAMAFRAPVDPLVFNLRASYDDETGHLVDHLTTDLHAARIAVLYQNDAFGEAGLNGTSKALERLHLTVAATGSFERNTTEIQPALATIQAAKPDAVLMIGPYKPVATFIQEARATGLTCPLATISFVGTENLIALAGPVGEGVIITQVVPDPTDPAIPLVREFHAALQAVKAGAKPTYLGLEGYASGKLLCLGLQRAGRDLSRAGLIAALDALPPTDLGGLTVAFTSTDHQASDAIYLTRVDGGKATTVEHLR